MFYKSELNRKPSCRYSFSPIKTLKTTMIFTPKWGRIFNGDIKRYGQIQKHDYERENALIDFALSVAI